MSAGGVYSLATIGAKVVIDIAAERVAKAVDSMHPSCFSNGFALSNMGCADAGTAMSMLTSTIRRIRAHSADAPISVYHTGQPRNTLNLGFSATAMHWFSRKPGNLSDHVHMVGARGKERGVFQTQAHQDWRRILLHRANELVPGGKLVLVNFCIDETGQYLGNTGHVHVFDTFNEIWCGYRDDGVISSREYIEMTLPQYYNTVEEFSRPMLDSNEEVYRAGLRLVDIETRVTPCPYAADFAGHGDVEKFAEAYIPTIRTWNQSTFFGALNHERPFTEREEILEAFYESYQGEGDS